ncbi:response regulator transcription factor [Kangiella sp. TOML190]|uniref:response regulator transcription factor n=1 Tax=Kangiella sp. TOML190 TaxID=2931351 RepID=UPI0020414CDA|nr:response regulator transcription factor [Kangiella sp. TOML190]
MTKQSKPSSSTPLRLLIVEDDVALANSIIEWFELDGHSCDYVADGKAAISLLSRVDFDVILLDVSLPYIDGLEVARRLRQVGNSTPILMLTARDAIEDRVTGLDSGADDYVVKPFALIEVSARVRVLSKRRTGEVQRLSIGSLELLLDEHRVFREGQEIDLSPIGWRLIETLARSCPNSVDRETLSFAAWHDEPPETNNLKVQMFKLRKAIDKPFKSSVIETVKGRGYRLLAKGTPND